MIFDNVQKKIDEGIVGENVGLDMRLGRLIDYVPNLQQETMYLIGGESGSGKSAFAYNHLLYFPYEDWLKNHSETCNFKAFVWSLEMSKEIITTKAICRQIWLENKILVDVNYVLSRGKNRISSEIYNLVKTKRAYFEKFEEHVEIFSAENPTGIWNTMLNYMETTGKIYTKPVETKTGTIQVFDKYVPYKNQYVLLIVDHISLLRKERGMNKKEVIDKMTEYAIELRDKFKITPIFVQQLNRNLSSTDRMKMDKMDPMLSDFAESSDTQHAANFIFSLFSPYRYDLKNYRGFNIDALGDRYRSLGVLKTRDGEANFLMGLGFLGETGLFKELPKASEMKALDYEQIINIKKYKL